MSNLKLRHGNYEDLKQSTCYTTPSGKVIEVKDSVKDLGVYMSSNCLFMGQINAVIQKAKNNNSNDDTLQIAGHPDT